MGTGASSLRGVNESTAWAFTGAMGSARGKEGGGGNGGGVERGWEGPWGAEDSAWEGDEDRPLSPQGHHLPQHPSLTACIAQFQMLRQLQLIPQFPLVYRFQLIPAAPCTRLLDPTWLPYSSDADGVCDYYSSSLQRLPVCVCA